MPAYHPDSPPAASRARDPHILVVDDEPTIRMGFRLSLVTEGFRVDVATNGEEALAQTLDSRFDLMFLDLRMPGIDGIGVLERLAAEDRWLPTIIASAHMDDSIVRQAIRLGVVDFLHKPVRPDDLRSIAHFVLSEEARARQAATSNSVLDRTLSEARCHLRRGRVDEALDTLQRAEPDVPGRESWIRIAKAADRSFTGRQLDPISLDEILASHPLNHEG